MLAEGSRISTDPVAMIESSGGRISERKLRLFAVECCRRHSDLLADTDSQSP